MSPVAIWGEVLKVGSALENGLKEEHVGGVWRHCDEWLEGSGQEGEQQQESGRADRFLSLRASFVLSEWEAFADLFKEREAWLGLIKSF